MFAAVGFQMLTDLQHVGAFANKRGRYEVDALLAAENQVALVFFRQRRQLDRDARQVNAFVLAEVAVVQHGTHHGVFRHFFYFHADQTIVYQHGVADFQIFSEASVGDGDALAVADHALVGGKGKGLSRFQGNVVTAFQFHGADFRTFGVEQNSGLTTGFLHHRAHVGDTLTVLGVIAVREVKAHNVHAGLKQLGQHLFRFGFRADSTNDLGLFHDRLSVSCDG